MKKIFTAAVAAILTFSISMNAKTPETPSMTRVAVETTAGNFMIGLYNDTPRHRDNFLKHVGDGFYNGLLFHRVIKDFMVQTGDPESRNAPKGKMLGAGDPGYTVEAEILCPTHVNRRGALAAARTGDNVNPERRSSGSQFYVVTGRKFTAAELDQMEKRAGYERTKAAFDRLARENNDSIKTLMRNKDREGLETLRQELIKRAEAETGTFAYTPAQREAYINEGGAPHLDGAYTVFGEVLSGMDTVERIENAATDQGDRPVDDIRIISMKILK